MFRGNSHSSSERLFSWTDMIFVCQIMNYSSGESIKCRTIRFGYIRSYAPRLILTANAENDTSSEETFDPVEEDEVYSNVLYDNTNGLPTSEANDIAQTNEGFI